MGLKGLTGPNVELKLQFIDKKPYFIDEIHNLSKISKVIRTKKPPKMEGLIDCESKVLPFDDTYGPVLVAGLDGDDIDAGWKRFTEGKCAFMVHLVGVLLKHSPHQVIYADGDR